MESTPTTPGAQLPKTQDAAAEPVDTAFTAQLQQVMMLQQLFQMQFFFSGLIDSLWLDQDDSFY